MPSWFLAAAAELSRRQWGDEVVVYDDRHARTHLLSAAAAGILQALESAPAGLTDQKLWDRLFDEAPEVEVHPASEDELAAFAALLDQLQRLELIEARP